MAPSKKPKNCRARAGAIGRFFRGFIRARHGRGSRHVSEPSPLRTQSSARRFAGGQQIARKSNRLILRGEADWKGVAFRTDRSIDSHNQYYGTKTRKLAGVGLGTTKPTRTVAKITRRRGMDAGFSKYRKYAANPRTGGVVMHGGTARPACRKSLELLQRRSVRCPRRSRPSIEPRADAAHPRAFRRRHSGR